MIIDKILNNNVVVIKDKNDQEKIVMGRGIAFQKKAGDTFDDAKVDKVFSLSSMDASTKFQELIADIPMEHIQLADQIITYAGKQLGKTLNDMIYISLTDHIYTAITRFSEGISVKNVLFWEICRFYPDEFEIGKHALDMIEEQLGVRLPQDEAGFIALHLANAEMDEGSMQNMYEITKVMQEIANIVRYVFNTEFDEKSVYYYRFITHLKFFAQRLINGKTYTDDNDDGLYEAVKQKYKNSFSCVEKIAAFIGQKYKYVLSKEEMLYLTIHIERVIYKTTRN